MEDLYLEKLIRIPFVYHYTSVESLFAILEEYRQEKELASLPFRAYNIYSVNDPREMKLGFDFVKKFLPKYECQIDNSMYLSEIYLNEINENRCREECYKKPSDGFVKWGYVPYTISFTTKRDFLPMWSLYGTHFKGICLKFSLQKLTEYISEACQFGFVSYDEDEEDPILVHNFNELYNWEANRMGTAMGIEEKIEELSLLCTCISPFVKSSDWAYEQEFRIVYNHNYTPQLDRVSIERMLKEGIPKKIVQPYFYYSVNPNALEEIIIGPKANYNVIEHILRNELKDCLLNEVKVTPSSIEIV